MSKTQEKKKKQTESKRALVEALNKIVAELPKSNCKVSWPSPYNLHVRFFILQRVYNWYPKSGTLWERQAGHVDGEFKSVKEVLAKLLEILRAAKRERVLDDDMDRMIAQNYT